MILVSFCVAIQCPNLRNPSNGQVTLSGNRLGSVATYSCNSGFSLEGVSRRTCQMDGRWSDSEPSCVGEFSQRRRKGVRECVNGSRKCAFVCNYVSKRSTITCSSLLLVIACESLQDPQNGRVTIRGAGPGSVAAYTCNPGFRLVGSQERRCQSDGTFSGSAPICERK